MKINKLSKKYEDWIGRHNVLTRTSITAFVSVYVFTIIYITMNNVNENLAKILLDTTSYIALISVLITILGPNTVVKIIEIYKGNNHIDILKNEIKNIEEKESEKNILKTDLKNNVEYKNEVKVEKNNIKFPIDL